VNLRELVAVTMVAVLLPACGRLGMGDQVCEDSVGEPTPANVLAAQAVPTARYTPCFRATGIGWDDIDFAAESGSAGIAVEHGTETFLTAVVTASCDVSGARRVMSGHTDIQKYIDVEQTDSDISILVLPVTTRQLSYSHALAERWNETGLRGRRLLLRVDADVTAPVATRIERARASHRYMWIIDELDMAENTLEMRAENLDPMTRLTAEEALDYIEDDVDTVVETYRGRWFFVFEGGCITYTFDVEGAMATSVAAAATSNLGFYPAYQLREGD
jgi:hypothetical protein